MLYADNMNLDIYVSETNSDSLGPDAVTDIPARLDEVESLTEEARRLLVHCEGALSEEPKVQEEAEALERWLESYRRGLSAARKLSESGPDMLEDISMRLRQALEELQRYEGEGGNPPTKTQQAKIADLERAVRRIGRLSTAIQDASFIEPKNHAA